MKLPGIASAFVLSFVSQSPKPLGNLSNQVLTQGQQPWGTHSSSALFPPSSSALPMSSTVEKEDVLEEFKMAELNTMLRWSSLVYSFAKLRKIVQTNDSTINEEGTVAFEDTELIYTQDAEDEPAYQGTHLRYPMTASGISDFMKKNGKWLVGENDKLGFNPAGDSEHMDIPTMRHLTFVDDEFDAEIIEFDDEFLDNGLATELVFAIIVNKTEKRITVVFRGSVCIKDFIVDAGIIKTNPEEINEFAGKRVRTHRGISNYLFGKTKEATESSKESKFSQIIYILQQLYNEPEYKEYKCFVTGHSLGGGLTQLLAFTLAGSKEADFIPKPIMGVSYASPSIGNKHFYNAYRRLEEERLVRHIRVSNEGDVVAAVPSLGYRQTGINLHAKKDGRMEVKYENNKKSFRSQFNREFKEKHGLTSYVDRIFKEDNKDILSMDIDELYANYADLK